ncbi:hypothetical protein ACNSZH_12175 [Burkholderia gladioli]|uniref:hypothetical protein n=1 Tax=Burkholderia gladioli TaxID=28095 RepID=UPI003B97FEF8
MLNRHELPRDALSACGYCDLLASHAYAPAAAAPADALLHPLVRRVPLLAPAPPPRSFPSLAAPARAPPSLA